MKQDNTFEPNLETYLKIKRNKSDFYEQNLFEPLKALFMWLMRHQYRTCNQSDYDDLLQLCLIRVEKDLKYYRCNRGMTIGSFVRMLITQEIHKNKKKKEKRQEREQELDTSCHQEESIEMVITDYNGTISYLQSLYSGSTFPRYHSAVIPPLVNILSNPDKWIDSSPRDRQLYLTNSSGQSVHTVKSVLSWLEHSASLHKTNVV